MELTDGQQRRYSRNLLLEGFGEEGQQRLLGARALVVGAGALGSICAMYLAGSGVGHITVADFDTLDISNLQRQLSFTENELGQKKAAACASRLRSINSEIDIEPLDMLLTAENIDALIRDFDIVAEGSDNPATKYLVSEACQRAGKPYCLGGVSQFYGQVMSWKPGFPGYSALFPDSAEPDGYLPCSVGGVLGPLPGVIGSLQAAEVVKILAGIGEPLFGRLLLFDALTMQSRTLQF